MYLSISASATLVIASLSASHKALNNLYFSCGRYTGNEVSPVSFFLGALGILFMLIVSYYNPKVIINFILSIAK